MTRRKTKQKNKTAKKTSVTTKKDRKESAVSKTETKTVEDVRAEIHHNNEEKVMQLLTEVKLENIDQVIEDGKTLSMFAALKGWEKLFKFTMEHHANLQLMDGKRTILDFAAKGRNLPILQMILDQCEGHTFFPVTQVIREEVSSEGLSQSLEEESSEAPQEQASKKLVERKKSTVKKEKNSKGARGALAFYFNDAYYEKIEFNKSKNSLEFIPNKNCPFKIDRINRSLYDQWKKEDKTNKLKGIIKKPAQSPDEIKISFKKSIKPANEIEALSALRDTLKNQVAIKIQNIKEKGLSPMMFLQTFTTEDIKKYTFSDHNKQVAFTLKCEYPAPIACNKALNKSYNEGKHSQLRRIMYCPATRSEQIEISFFRAVENIEEVVWLLNKATKKELTFFSLNENDKFPAYCDVIDMDDEQFTGKILGRVSSHLKHHPKTIVQFLKSHLYLNDLFDCFRKIFQEKGIEDELYIKKLLECKETKLFKEHLLTLRVQMKAGEDRIEYAPNFFSVSKLSCGKRSNENAENNTPPAKRRKTEEIDQSKAIAFDMIILLQSPEFDSKAGISFLNDMNQSFRSNLKAFLETVFHEKDQNESDELSSETDAYIRDNDQKLNLRSGLQCIHIEVDSLSRDMVNQIIDYLVKRENENTKIQFREYDDYLNHFMMCFEKTFRQNGEVGVSELQYCAQIINEDSSKSFIVNLKKLREKLTLHCASLETSVTTLNFDKNLPVGKYVSRDFWKGNACANAFQYISELLSEDFDEESIHSCINLLHESQRVNMKKLMDVFFLSEPDSNPSPPPLSPLTPALEMFGTFGADESEQAVTSNCTEDPNLLPGLTTGYFDFDL